MKKFLFVFILQVVVTTPVSSQYLNWAFSIGSAYPEQVNSITLDHADNLFAIGSFSNTCDFDPGPGTFNLTTSSGSNNFITKYSASGNLIWAKQLGTNNGGYLTSTSIVADSAGNTYITGQFSGMQDFNPGPGTFTLTALGYDETFMMKLDPVGNFMWAKRLAGAGHSNGESITLGPDNSIYLTGYFIGTTDFDPGLASYNLVSEGNNNNEDIFILKLNALGNFAWAKRMGGDSHDQGKAITTDIDGNIYTTGFFSDSADFGADTKISSGEYDMFVTKMNASGTLLWTATMGGDFEDKYESIDVDDNGLIYLAGKFEDVADFDPDSAGIFNLTAYGNDDLCVAKLDSSGELIWAKQFGGFYADGLNDIKLDDSSNIYTLGYFNETADFDPGPGIHDLISVGFSDGYIAKWDSLGNFIWVKQLGGADYNGYKELTLDASNNLYACGVFYGTVDFDPNAGTYPLTSIGSNDAFLQKIGDPLPPSADFDAPASICAGDTVQFTNSTQFGPATYQWTFPGGNPSSSSNTNPLVIYSTPGSYNVTLIATNINGIDTLSLINYMVVNPLPAIPVITDTYPNLHSSYATGNQWYLNGTLIPGATGENYHPTINGNYTVEYTNGSGCASTSAPYAFTTLGNEPSSPMEKIILYPNPAHHFLQVKTMSTSEASFKITDLSGKICLTGQLKGPIEISHLSNGIYLFEIIIDDSIYREKWIKY